MCINSWHAERTPSIFDEASLCSNPATSASESLSGNPAAPTALTFSNHVPLLNAVPLHALPRTQGSRDHGQPLPSGASSASSSVPVPRAFSVSPESKQRSRVSSLWRSSSGLEATVEVEARVAVAYRPSKRLERAGSSSGREEQRQDAGACNDLGAGFSPSG
jgi:hypothetical protein